MSDGSIPHCGKAPRRHHQNPGLEGRQIYVPAKAAEKREKNIKSLGDLHYNRGLSIAKIADREHLSSRRVAEVLRQYRERFGGESGKEPGTGK